MVCVYDKGKTTVIPENPSRSSTLQTGGILLVSSNEFVHIKEFQLQKRKYHSVEFRNVSLQPGAMTAVAVLDAPGFDARQSGGTPESVATDVLAYGLAMERSLLLNTSGMTDTVDLESNQIVNFQRLEGPVSACIGFVDDTDSNAFFIQGDWGTLGDFPPISSRPCQAHTKSLERMRAGHVGCQCGRLGTPASLSFVVRHSCLASRLEARNDAAH